MIRKNKIQTLLAILMMGVICFSVSFVVADEDEQDIEETIGLEEVPLDVLAVIKESWGFVTEDKVIDTEKVTEGGKIYYEMEFKGMQEGQTYSVKTSESGVPVEVEREVGINEVPEDVIEAIKKAYPNMRIMESQIVYNIIYEIEGVVDRTFCEMSVEGAGKILEQECDK